MTEQFEPESAQSAERSIRTGMASVDAVLEQVESLSGRELDEHVAVLTQAHKQLRSALDVPADPA